jgi:hypothetical protein
MKKPARMVRSIYWGVVASLSFAVVHALEPCRIDIVDADSGWPVPLVELRTTHEVRFVSDNAGVIAFDLPELMGVETWFTVEGHGYGVPKDGYGYHGIRLTPMPGKRLTVKVNRTFPAKRLGRITGAGLFAESQQLGLEKTWRDQGIMGCDSVQGAVHQGKFHWLWGDTTLARYPLGLFHMIGATTALQPLASFEPPIRLRYDYVMSATGNHRVVGRMPGEGPTWINGLVSLPDRDGGVHLVATYVKIEPPLTAYESGQCIWDDASARFKPHRVLWKKTVEEPKPPPGPGGHPVFFTDAAGKTWVLFGDPFPRLKCAATFEAWSDPEIWQHLSPQASVPVRDGEAITPHRGSIAWNVYRGKWVAIFTQLGGRSSYLGEIWYAESREPTGPWGSAVKVLSHAKYSFYNPCIHAGLSPAGSPVLLFEGTYTREFAQQARATPRFNYNQVLYRLDLDDPVFARD